MDSQSKKPPLNVVNFLFLVVSPIVALLGLIIYPLYFDFLWQEWLLFGVFMWMTGLSITAGYHRLWSHKTYKASFLPRLFYAFWGACSVQNSVFQWASDHRRHHLYVDDWDKDPYSAKRGFFFSHMGWIFRQYQSGDDDFSNIKDLLKDPILRFQDKYYVYIAIVANIVVPMALGYFLCNGNPWGMLILCGALRLVLNHHLTFLINSLAHIWGRQPFSDKNTSKDNGLISLFTYGEGYHNFHHQFQSDYRNGIRWWDYDPSKWSIFLLSKFGLAKGLKRTTKEKIETAVANMQLAKALEKLDDAHLSFDEMATQLKEKYQAYIEKLEELFECKRQWLIAKKDDLVSKAETSELRQRYLELKESFKRERLSWNQFIAV